MADVTSITVNMGGGTYGYGTTAKVFWTCSPAAVAGTEFGIWEVCVATGAWFTGAVLEGNGTTSYSLDVTLGTTPIGLAYWAVGWRTPKTSGTWTVWGDTSANPFRVQATPGAEGGPDVVPAKHVIKIGSVDIPVVG